MAQGPADAPCGVQRPGPLGVGRLKLRRLRRAKGRPVRRRASFIHQEPLDIYHHALRRTGPGGRPGAPAAARRPAYTGSACARELERHRPQSAATGSAVESEATPDRPRIVGKSDPSRPRQALGRKRSEKKHKNEKKEKSEKKEKTDQDPEKSEEEHT